MASEDVVSDPEIVAIVAEKEYCNSALKLLEAVESAISRVEEMTKSKTVSDVIEAIDFLPELSILISKEQVNLSVMHLL